VVASDTGVPSLSSSVIVTVYVTDVNDNQPTFDRPVYESAVSDQAPRGQFVTAVQAFDADVTDRGRLTYAIVNGNERQVDHLFRFKSTSAGKIPHVTTSDFLCFWHTCRSKFVQIMYKILVLYLVVLPLQTLSVASLKLTACSRPTAPSGSAKCLRFGHWLTSCPPSIALTYLLTFVQEFLHLGAKVASHVFWHF